MSILYHTFSDDYISSLKFLLLFNSSEAGEYFPSSCSLLNIWLKSEIHDSDFSWQVSNCSSSYLRGREYPPCPNSVSKKWRSSRKGIVIGLLGQTEAQNRIRFFCILCCPYILNTYMYWCELQSYIEIIDFKLIIIVIKIMHE